MIPIVTIICVQYQIKLLIKYVAKNVCNECRKIMSQYKSYIVSKSGFSKKLTYWEIEVDK